MFRSFSTALVLAAALPSIAAAQAQNGFYQLGAACLPQAAETRVRVTNNVIEFYESVCTLSNPTAIQGTNGYSYVANCAGEGVEWQANYMMIPLNGGSTLRMVRDGSVYDYTLCGPGSFLQSQ